MMKASHRDVERVVNAEVGAPLIGIKPSTLRKWAHTRRVASLKIGSALRFRVGDLLALVEARPARPKTSDSRRRDGSIRPQVR
jgi:hypothetical protein